MKKKVFLGLIFVTIFFTIGGLYLTNTFNNTTETLQQIITLKQMEFQKKSMLSKLETIQTDLLLKDSPHGVDLNHFTLDVKAMEEELEKCNDCHHAELMNKRINQLREDTRRYLQGLSRVYTFQASEERELQEVENAFENGTGLINQINDIIQKSTKTVVEESTLAKTSVAETKNILILLVTAGPLILILSAYYFIKGCTRSLSVLTNATGKLKYGDLQYRIEEELKDEFGELAASFNEMAVSIQEQYNRLQEAERLAVVGELAAGMAHEIKNPLAGIKVSIEVMIDDLNLDQEEKEIFLQIVNEIDRINSLLKSLLNYARPPKPEFVFFDVHQVLETTIKSAQFSLKSPKEGAEGQRKEIEFIKDFSPDIPNIIADPGQLQQVFLNLILNSVDAIAKRGVITVKTRESSNETVEITISDNGKGIEDQDIDRIFKPFFTTKSHGTGLGLAICKRLIEQHNGGSITASNNPEGEGVSFVITLPIQPSTEINQQ